MTKFVIEKKFLIELKRKTLDKSLFKYWIFKSLFQIFVWVSVDGNLSLFGLHFSIDWFWFEQIDWKWNAMNKKKKNWKGRTKKLLLLQSLLPVVSFCSSAIAEIYENEKILQSLTDLRFISCCFGCNKYMQKILKNSALALFFKTFLRIRTAKPIWIVDIIL